MTFDDLAIGDIFYFKLYGFVANCEEERRLKISDSLYKVLQSESAVAVGTTVSYSRISSQRLSVERVSHFDSTRY